MARQTSALALAGDPAGLADIEQATRLHADVAEVMIDTDDEDP